MLICYLPLSKIQSLEVAFLALSMNINLPIFITVLTYFISSCQSTKRNVAKALVGFFNNYEKNSNDLAAAATLVESLKFDRFNEKTSCVVDQGIALTHYPTVIENFARDFSVPNDVKQSLLDAQYATDTTELVQNFKFKKGNTGNFVYGRFATIKHGDKIDIAYSLYTLDFKLSPIVIQHRRRRRRRRRRTTTSERNLSANEKGQLEQHFIYKAITKFRSKYANLIEAGDGQYCDAHGNCS